MDAIDVTRKDLNKILGLMVSSRKRFKFSCTGKSMFPFFHNCDFVEVEPVNFRDVRIGDVIFYHNRHSNLIAHRVVKRIREKGHFKLVTKGDFASSIDKPVEEKDFIGKVVAVNSRNRLVSSYLGINRYSGFIIAMISLLTCCIWPVLKAVKYRGRPRIT